MKKIAAQLAAVAIAIPAVLGVGVATAPAANAATASSCRIIDAGYGYTLGASGYRYATYCYIDYDWMEEVFFGYRDGWRIVRYHTERCDYVYNVC